jgi:hypothetical protein
MSELERFLSQQYGLKTGLLVKRAPDEAHMYEWSNRVDQAINRELIKDILKWGRCLRCCEKSTKTPFCTNCGDIIAAGMLGWAERNMALEEIWDLYESTRWNRGNTDEEDLWKRVELAKDRMKKFDRIVDPWTKEIGGEWTEKAVFMRKMLGLRMGYLDHIQMDPPTRYRWMRNERITNIIPDYIKKEVEDANRCVRCCEKPGKDQQITYATPYCIACDELTLNEETGWKKQAAEFNLNRRKTSAGDKWKPPNPDSCTERDDDDFGDGSSKKRTVSTWTDAAIREKTELDAKKAKKLKKK